MNTPDVLRDYIYSNSLKFFLDVKEVVLFDYPNYLNFGDHLIWLGELAFLRKMGVEVAGQFHIGQCALDLLQETVGDKLIVLQGGGNFGDLYPWHQGVRRRIIERFKANQIVMFPQTMYYSNQELVRTDVQIYSKHPNLHLIWRDAKSFELGQEYFKKNQSYLVPDMAFCLEPTKTVPLGKEQFDILFLKRTDKERKQDQFPGAGHRFHFKDWTDFVDRSDIRVPKVNTFDRFIRWIYKRADKVMGSNLFLAACTKETESFHRVANQCERVAVSEFSRHKVIISDRLHGHILSTLLRIPNILLDNLYGKNRQFYETWTGQDAISKFANNWEEVILHLDRFKEEGIL